MYCKNDEKGEFIISLPANQQKTKLKIKENPRFSGEKQRKEAFVKIITDYLKLLKSEA